MAKLALVSFLCVVWVTLRYVSGHGMVIDPVNRSSRWRYNSSAPDNWDDDGLNCGGFGSQWDVNHGKCGLCGDDYSLPTPRPNELGGLYGEGVIVKNYGTGQKMPVTVRLTANHRGYFKFYLCVLDGHKESESCFDQHPLRLSNGADRFLVPLDKRTGLFHMTLQLPQGVSCEHCVLQWIYNTGNSWGWCSNGKGAMGCGKQENYRTCSDISIGNDQKLMLETSSPEPMPETVADDESMDNMMDS